MLKVKVSLNDLENGKKLVKEKAQRVLMRSMFKMEELAITKAPFDTGYLRGNITLFPEVLSNKYVITSNAPYSEDLEYGNIPRTVDYDQIVEWVKRKGIRTEDKNALAFAYYVKKKIKRVGVNAQPYMRPAFFEVQEVWLPVIMKEEFSSD